MISLCQSCIHSQTFCHKIFFYFVDITCATVWRKYRVNAAKLGCFVAAAISLLNFKRKIAEVFSKQEKTAQKRKGRPSSTVEQDFETKHKVGLENHYWKKLYKKMKLPIFQSFYKMKQVQHARHFCKLDLCFTPKFICFLKFHMQ